MDCSTTLKPGQNATATLQNLLEIRAADFKALQILPYILKLARVIENMMILSSTDVIMGSVGRMPSLDR
jgi:NADH:ubiquinone oxidoreductase subunit D